MKKTVKKSDLQVCHVMNTRYLEIVKAAKDCHMNGESALYVSNLTACVLRFASVAGEEADKATATPTGTSLLMSVQKAAERYNNGESVYDLETAVFNLGEAVFNCQTQEGKPIFIRRLLEGAIADALQSLLTVSDRVNWGGNITHGKNAVKYDMGVYYKSACRELGFTPDSIFN